MSRKLGTVISSVLLVGLALTSPVRADLVGWWTLDEGSGTIAYDSSGNGNDGMLEGDAQWVVGKIGGALEGDGTGDYVRVPNSDSLTISDAVTVAMWLFGGQPPDQPICKGADGSAWSSGIALRLDDNPSRHIDFRGRTNTTNGLNSETAIPADEWVHITATFDINAEGNNQKIYINGVLDAEKRVDAPLATNTADLLIGADGYSTTRWHWQGMIDDVRIYNEAVTAKQVGAIMLGGGLTTGKAANPDPAAEAIDVPRDVILGWKAGEYAATHDVYFGTVFADVNAASTADPMGALASSGQDANTVDPEGVLGLAQTYYWRVDEVNAAPDFTVLKGDVWSFTVEPVAYPVTNVTATASSMHTADNGPEKTVDGSGLDAADLHSVAGSDMWLSGGTDPGPVWIQYEFDGVYKLHEMWVWNSNQLIESFVGFGVKDVVVEYSVDGVDWAVLDGATEFAKAPGSAGYAHNTTVDFGGVMARYVKITISDNWGLLGQYSLSEVRFYSIPVNAREPQPAAGQDGVALDVVLDWRAGREAASHEVYFSTDRQAVVDGTALLATVDVSNHALETLEYGQTYYWKINEVNAAATPASVEGDVWSFTSTAYLVVDDMESYTNDIDAGQAIFQTWIDGWENGTGSVVGYLAEPFAERTIVNGGKQSLPLDYNNVNSPWYSEAERAWESPQNWTLDGADTLTLYFRGNAVGFVETGPDSFTMGAAGADIWNAADEFRYAFKKLSGDGSIVAKVDSLVNTNDWAKVGVMIRESLDAGSTFAGVFITPANGCRYQARAVPNAAATSDTDVVTAEQTAITAPSWVKLERTGNTFNGYYSADGAAWTAMSWNPQTVMMIGNVYVGLAATSHAAGVSTVAEFSNVATTGAVSGQWQSLAIGVEQPANDPAPLYVALEDTAGHLQTVTHADPQATLATEWQEWAIPLSAFSDAGVNVTKVTRMLIGVGDRDNPTPDGAGLLYVDDIRVGRPAPVAEPDTVAAE